MVSRLSSPVRPPRWRLLDPGELEHQDVELEEELELRRPRWWANSAEFRLPPRFDRIAGDAAYLLGEKGPDGFVHGTRSGAARHRRRGESVCEACRLAECQQSQKRRSARKGVA